MDGEKYLILSFNNHIPQDQNIVRSMKNDIINPLVFTRCESLKTWLLHRFYKFRQ